MEESEQAIVDWLHTFAAGQECSQLVELKDGKIFINILHEICPEFFDPESVQEAGENWALAAGNLRTILRQLDDYFTNQLAKRIDIGSIDVNDIAKNGNVEEITALLELVVGAAVLCENKAQFISNIFQLNHTSQIYLKSMVEQVLSRAEDIGGDAADANNQGEEEDVDAVEELELHPAGAKTSDEESRRTDEMLRHLQDERQRLLQEIRTLEHSNSDLKRQVTELKQKTSLTEQERAARDGSDRQRLEAAESTNLLLQKELDDIKRELDHKVSESDTLKNDYRLLQQRLHASQEIQAKLEMENRQQSDDLDLAREKLAQLVKAEQSVERYQKKLEEMINIKKQNKELSEKMDQYLDKIHELESANKGLSSLSRMVEQYKNRAVELEREKFEALSTVQTLEQQITQQNSDLQRAVDTRHKLEDEVNSLQVQLQQLSDVDDLNRSTASAGLKDDSFSVESVTTLKEKIKLLERDLKVARSTVGGDSNDEVVTILRQELEDVKAMKKEREDMYLLAKKQITEMQHELAKQTRAAEEQDRSSASTAALKDVTQKLAATNNTIKLLEEKLKEKESSINRLEQDKNKLETYARKSLSSFKEKIQTVMNKLREEKLEAEEKLRMHIEKTERNQETAQREERLLSAALFEVGVKIMDRKIQSQLSDQLQPQQNSFLGVQRDALSKSATDILAGKSPAGAATAAQDKKLFGAAPTTPLK